jgi:sucrose-6-phosphate hydrolase SacC (GH32 family)
VFRDPGRWIWDSWLVQDGPTYHLFFLQAPSALGDPTRRHARASVGHASSTDLTTWVDHGTALGPSLDGWDDLAIWTGSVVRGDDGVWRMYYTAISTAGNELRDQRIGVAVSDDLLTWRRVGHRPVLEADPRWYQTLGIEGNPASETWRDPFVFRDPGGDGWHMLVTARRRGAERLDDGVLAHARSHDLVAWEVGPPVSGDSAGFGQLEVPQVRMVDGQALLVFTCHPEEQSQRRRETSGYYCTWSVVGDSLLGPWDITRAQPFRAEPHLFAAPLATDPSGGLSLLGFRNTEPQGRLQFWITDPIPVALHAGALVPRP